MGNFLQDFPQDFLTRFSHRISHKISDRISGNISSRISCKIFHKISCRISYKISLRISPKYCLQNFPQDFPIRFPQDCFFPERFSHKIFPSRILIGWLPITLFQILNFHQSLPLLNWLFPSTLFCKIFLQDFHARISCKIFPLDFLQLDPDLLAPHHPIPNDKFPPITAFLKLAFSPQPCPARFQTDFPVRFPAEFPSRFSLKNFPQDFPTRFSCKNFLQEFPTIFSCKIFPQDFSELDPDWLAPHHPIPNAKFPPITAFLKLAFSPSSCPARISCKIFLQDFPARFSHKIFLSWILIGCLLITLFDMLNFH